MRDQVWRRLSWRKRLTYRAARWIPARWRFRWSGLPATSPIQPDPVGAKKPTDLSHVPGGTACHQGAHLDAMGRMISSVSPGANGPMEERFILRQRFFPKVKKMRGTLASLALDGDINYFHWLMETLPRWKFLQGREGDLSALYVCQRHPFHRESLRMLGAKPELIRDSSAIPYLSAEDIIVPRYIQRTEPWIVPWLRKHFRVKPGVQSFASRGRRIYISRRAASSRGIANKAELLPVLDEFGFVSVVLESLPWLDQVALFGQAEAVVAAHGAGLTNLVFCDAPAFVVELTPIGLTGPFYEEIGASLRLDYHTVRCPPAGTGDLHARPIVADVKVVRDLLKSRLG